MSNKAIYPGSFDPITLGHLDIVRRASNLFDHVLVAVAASEKKNIVFSMDERVALANEAVKFLDNVEVTGFQGMMVKLAESYQAKIVIRGIRTISDFEYEMELAYFNRHLFSELESIFLFPSNHLSYISSSMIKEIAGQGGDVSSFLTPSVNLALLSKLQVPKG